MSVLKIISYLISFGVIALIGIRTLDTGCFNLIDMNLSLGALIFSAIIEVYLLKRR